MTTSPRSCTTTPNHPHRRLLGALRRSRRPDGFAQQCSRGAERIIAAQRRGITLPPFGCHRAGTVGDDRGCPLVDALSRENDFLTAPVVAAIANLPSPQCAWRWALMLIQD